MNRQRIVNLERKAKQGKYDWVVVVNNHKEGDPLPDNVGPDTIVINLIDPITEESGVKV